MSLRVGKKNGCVTSTNGSKNSIKWYQLLTHDCSEEVTEASSNLLRFNRENMLFTVNNFVFGICGETSLELNKAIRKLLTLRVTTKGRSY